MNNLVKNLFHKDLIFGKKKKRKENEIELVFYFSFASHWKDQKRSFRTLTKAYGLRFIISVCLNFR
jgi:plasmid replication initiation protein